jgi:phage-related protein (TIGR01555 family)
MLMLSLYRSSWIIRKVIDVIPEDMLKDFPSLSTENTPEEVKKFDKVIRSTGTQTQMMRGLKWGRLFGGAVSLIAIRGAVDLMEPLDPEDIDLNSYRGLIPYDRWSGVFPGAEIVDDIDFPMDYGLPEYYTITTERGTMNVHHSRVIRHIGRDLPEWERQAELYWGLSECELVYEELKKRDYISWNISSLVTRAQILAIKDPELAQKQSGATMSTRGWNSYLNRMTEIAEGLNNQGLLVMGKDGQLESFSYSFAGLSDIQNNVMLDVSGACEIPVSRLFGRTISGLGQTGEGDLQIYYDTIEQKRNRELGPVMDKLFPIICMSTFGKIPKDLDYTFTPVRTMSQKDKQDLAQKSAEAIVSLYEADLMTKKESRLEIKQASIANGLGSNITDEAIAATPDTYASEAGGGELDIPGMPKGGGDDDSDDSGSDAAVDAGPMSSEYAAALEESRKASQRYTAAVKAYREGARERIGNPAKSREDDRIFLAAKAAWAASEKEFDAAYAKEERRK